MGVEEALLCEGWPTTVCIACVHVPLLSLIFAGLALICDAHLVPAIEHMVLNLLRIVAPPRKMLTFRLCVFQCGRLGIPPQAAAASFLALATAAPEIVINIAATATGRVEISLSAIMGSSQVCL